MKTGKEIKLNSLENYNVVLGTVNNHIPKSMYLQISSWGLPKKEYDNYNNIIKNKTRRVKNRLYEILDGNVFYKDKTIVDFNMASSGVNMGKRSYMCVDITFFKKTPYIPINNEEIIPIFKDITDNIINGVFETDEDFEFYKTKK